MENKDWLIRTKNNHILGPISKKKLLELLENENIRQDDELCSGNGYWFKVEERELMDKYVYGDIKQEFDPVSDVASVVAGKVVDVAADADEEVHFPDDSDLEYPEDGSVLYSGEIDSREEEG